MADKSVEVRFNIMTKIHANSLLTTNWLVDTDSLHLDFLHPVCSSLLHPLAVLKTLILRLSMKFHKAAVIFPTDHFVFRVSQHLLSLGSYNPGKEQLICPLY